MAARVASALRVSEAAAAHIEPLRLPRVDAAVQALSNQIVGRAALSEFVRPGKSLLWRWHADRTTHAPELTLVCAAGGVHCALSFDADDGPGLDEGIDLEAFDGAALLAAATLRYAAVLAHVDRISGRRFDAIRIHRGGHLLDAQALTLGFTLTDAAQAPRALTGTLQILPSQAASWSQLQGRAAALPAAAARLPVAAQIWLAQRLSVRAASLRRLRVGGALLLGTATADGLPCRVQWPGGQLAWSALQRGSRLQLRAPTTAPAETFVAAKRSFLMDSLPSRADADADAETDVECAAMSAAIDSMPIVLDFHVGEASVPLSDLPAALAPGYMIELGRPLDAQTVTVRANGQLLAHGELIQVGDQLAVRISRLAGGANSDGSV
jgi:type III secretion system YscQ/HrcQ family protein